MAAMRYEYFGPELLELNRELRNHPDLARQLAERVLIDFETRIAGIAAYCGVALDGAYDKDDLENIAKLCLTELKKKSTLIVSSSYH